MAYKFDVKSTGIVGKGGFLQFATEYAFKLDKGLTTPTANMVIQIARFGNGSITEQFAREATIFGSNSASPWAPRFNTPQMRSVSGSLLNRSGAYKKAWQGKGRGSFRSTKDKKRVSFGVNRGAMPMATMHQNEGVTTYRYGPRRRVAIGMATGLWLRNPTGVIRTPGRPVSLNDRIANRALDAMAEYFLTGKLTEVSG